MAVECYLLLLGLRMLEVVRIQLITKNTKEEIKKRQQKPPTLTSRNVH